MESPIDTFRKWQSRMGKPIRPIVEFQKNASVCSIITTSIQTENMVQDAYRNEAWEVHPDDQTVAVYVDGLFKGIGYYAGEEGATLKMTKGTAIRVTKDVQLERQDTDQEGKILSDRMIPMLNASYKGQLSKLLDASLLERVSSLKPSFIDKLIFMGIGVLIGAVMVMSYAKQ